MTRGEISRARFLTGVAGLAGVAAGAVGVTAATAGATAGASDPDPAPAPGPRYRGVTYDVSVGWSRRRMCTDLRVIAEDLHATSVSVFGSGVERLAATAAEAAERGLHVWIQPRLGDVPLADILDHLAEAGREAERLRRQGAAVDLSVGCEFLLYVPGIVPGADVMERIENLMSGNFDPEHMVRRLHEVIGQAAATGRSVFRGALTYAAEPGEAAEIVDWDLFDLVSLDYYAHHPRREDYVRDLAPFRRLGKPLAIAEFGACAYEGATEDGGMGWNVVDYSKPRPEIVGGLVRSEETQARYLTDVFGAFATMDLYAAMVYTFVNPECPHWPEPRYDLDMANYTLVKALWHSPDGFEHGWHWEPKLAFHTLARLFADGRPATR
ncbi:abortive phage infection protein [Streptomyces sp. 4N509B]|uniref:abortive phage infection protein n=1 Tax=Streptomyces sp. 4N509B TaxID=3457413 RepID=UPI003FD04FFE